MKMVKADARRYVWCRSQAAWLMGPPAHQWLEDLRGAVAINQQGLIHYVVRQLAEDCAVMLTLALTFERPAPPPALRGSWALERLEGHPLRDECWALMRGFDELPPGEELIERCERLQKEVRKVVGDVPNPISPEGYFPSMSLARRWMELVQELDEEGFLPRDWMRG
ncbi:MAG: hypothetical protein R2725_07540 [Solirubrobacterales bacterium]